MVVRVSNAILLKRLMIVFVPSFTSALTLDCTVRYLITFSFLVHVYFLPVPTT